MNSKQEKPAKCRDCGSSNVAWKQSKAGKWYLADIRSSKLQARASNEYVAGPHFRSCQQPGHARLAAAERQFQADAWMFMDADERHYARMERDY